MKIALAQIHPIKGDIQENLRLHQSFVLEAVNKGVDLVLFPELSLTGYEPELAQELALTPNDPRLDIFQELSDENQLVVGVGMPTLGENGVRISLVFFQPNQQRKVYSKQHLHEDEWPYFESGERQEVFIVKDETIVPAICYESLLPEHVEQAHRLNASLYLTSVAKPERGVQKALVHYPQIARKYQMTVAMCNCVGPSDNFISTGQSAVWNANGELMAQLTSDQPELLVLDLRQTTVTFTSAPKQI